MLLLWDKSQKLREGIYLSICLHSVVIAFFILVSHFHNSAPLVFKLTQESKKKAVLFVKRNKFQKKSAPAKSAHVSKTKTVQKKVPKKTKKVIKKITKPVIATEKTSKFKSVYARSLLPEEKKIKPAKKVIEEKVIEEKKEPEMARTALEEKIVQEVEEPAEELEVVESDDFADVYQEIYEHWNMPEGFSPDLSCTYKVIIDKEGNVVDVVVQKSSGVLVYDTAAQAALFTTIYSKIVWGKEFIITFDKEGTA